MDYQNDTNTLANVGTITVAGNTLTISGTGSMNIPSGTTAQRPSSTAAAGSVRYNTSISNIEVYTGFGWFTAGAGPLSGLTDVSITSPTSGQFLTYNGTTWINTTSLSSSNVSYRHILVGDSITNANVSNLFVRGVNSGDTADRAVTVIDGNASVKIVSAGYTPSVELQEYDSTLNTQNSYWDIASSGGNFVVRDRRYGNTFTHIMANAATGTVSMDSIYVNASIYSNWRIDADGPITANGAISSINTITGSNLIGYNSGDQTIVLTGDVTGSGTGTFTATLASTGITAGTYTSLTVDAKGRATAGSTTQTWATLTSTPTTLAGYGITDAVSASAGTFTGNILLTNANAVLTIPASASALPPTAPSAGNVTIFGRALAGREMVAMVDSDGFDSTLQPAIWRQKIGRWSPMGNSTTMPVSDGYDVPTTLGTATARAIATTNLFTRTRRMGYVSASGAGSFCGHYNTLAAYTTGDGTGLGGFFYSCRFGFSDTANPTGTRAFIGLTSSVSAPTNVEPSTLTNCIGVAQLSTSATQLYFVHGGSSAQTAVALGTNFPPYTGTGATLGVLYDLTIYAAPGLNGMFNYRVERVGTSFVAEGTFGSSAGTVSPLPTTLLAHRAWRTNNANTGVVGIDIVNIYTETDY